MRTLVKRAPPAPPLHPLPFQLSSAISTSQDPEGRWLLPTRALLATTTVKEIQQLFAALTGIFYGGPVPAPIEGRKYGTLDSIGKRPRDIGRIDGVGVAGDEECRRRNTAGVDRLRLGESFAGLRVGFRILARNGFAHESDSGWRDLARMGGERVSDDLVGNVGETTGPGETRPAKKSFARRLGGLSQGAKQGEGGDKRRLSRGDLLAYDCPHRMADKMCSPDADAAQHIED